MITLVSVPKCRSFTRPRSPRYCTVQDNCHRRIPLRYERRHQAASWFAIQFNWIWIDQLRFNSRSHDDFQKSSPRFTRVLRTRVSPLYLSVWSRRGMRGSRRRILSIPSNSRSNRVSVNFGEKTLSRVTAVTRDIIMLLWTEVNSWGKGVLKYSTVVIDNIRIFQYTR